MSLDLVPLWAGILALSVFMYVLLDGFDLGIGILSPLAPDDNSRDQMMDSIAPIWDGNETWLVMGGIALLAAFPMAFAIIIPAVYFPILFMLIGLLFRGVAFEFRHMSTRKKFWDWSFHAGSLVATFAQGIVLGTYVQGIPIEGRHFSGSSFEWATPFAVLTGLGLIAGYGLIGACWLVMKTEGELQRKAVDWARLAWLPVVGGLILISMATPWISATVRERWFALPEAIALMAIPLMTGVALYAVRALLGTRAVRGPLCWLPFVLLIGVFLLGFLGLAYSIYPYVVIDRLTVWQAASSPGALKFIGVGVAISVPAIAGYTVFSYRVFRGKTGELKYA